MEGGDYLAGVRLPQGEVHDSLEIDRWLLRRWEQYAEVSRASILFSDSAHVSRLCDWQGLLYGAGQGPFASGTI